MRRSLISNMIILRIVDERHNQVMSKYNIQNTLYQKTTTFNT